MLVLHVKDMRMDSTIPRLNESLCTLCGLCVEACHCGAIQMGEEGPVFSCPAQSSCPRQEMGDCECLCEDVCPTGAISCAFEIVLEDPERRQPREPEDR